MKQSFESSSPDRFTVEQPDKLPLGQLLCLTLASFLATANETIPAGLLNQIANGFMTNEAWAGQTVTFCALGAGISAIPLTIFTKRYQQRSLLLVALITFAFCNLLTALSSSFLFVLFLRFVIGLATGLAWSILATYARSMAPPNLQGRALAIAMFGIPLALALGVPLSAWLSHFMGWRFIFDILSLIATVLAAWILFKIPNYSKETNQQRIPLKHVIQITGVRPILFIVMAWILSHYLLYTYITPLLSYLGLTSQIDVILLIFGLATLVGIWIVGIFVDQFLKRLFFMNLGSFLLISILLSLNFTHLGFNLFICLTILWGLSFSGAPTLLQTLLANAAKENADIAQSLLVTVFNLSFAFSGILGGILLETVGVQYFSIVIALILSITMIITFKYQKHIFI
ncbi:MFS transporter [Acinetobacter colistiniresistens]|uniref:MFS transporter n=1 Tax=Acinetobacter colistiniresistens TaxID=280145 RepID=UPI00211BB787|nr:MFS transporter [Acinetobacter colistiniresistens]UUM26579.1 MFS transporter [Acinetobacter colistiniresistens]